MITEYWLATSVKPAHKSVARITDRPDMVSAVYHESNK